MRIRITKSGIYRDGVTMIPVGTELDVPDDFKGWANKWVRVDSPKATLEVATPAKQPEPEEDTELDQLRDEYERVTGEKPHGRMKAETLKQRIEEDHDLQDHNPRQVLVW